MNNSALKKVTPIRPHLEVVERQVADIEDGFIMIAMQLYEELIGANLTRNQAKVAHAVCRKTYGFKKKMDRIADSQIAELARISRSKANIAKNELIAMKVLLSEGGKIGPNKNIHEWLIPECSQADNFVSKSGTKSVFEMDTQAVPKTEHTKDIFKDKKENTQTHKAGLVAELKLTPRQKGTNPRATKTNPRSATPAFDRDRFKDTWNCKATKFGLPTIRSITTTTESGIKRLWQSYLKQCRELGKEPRDIDTFINGYIEFGYQPTEWACGANPSGKKYGIETALRQEKIDQILAQGD